MFIALYIKLLLSMRPLTVRNLVQLAKAYDFKQVPKNSDLRVSFEMSEREASSRISLRTRSHLTGF